MFLKQSVDCINHQSFVPSLLQALAFKSYEINIEHDVKRRSDENVTVLPLNMIHFRFHDIGFDKSSFSFKLSLSDSFEKQA